MHGFRKCLRARPLAWIIAAASVNVVAAGQAIAQDSDSAPSGASTGTNGVAPIIVTANRREENLQDVPIAISAVTGDRLQALGAVNTRDLGTLVPSLTIHSSPAGTSAHLRGVGTSLLGPGTENSIATYIDNVYIGSMSGSLVQLNSIAQIEVLKGPQGTLFGRNATGGVINVRTRDPDHTPGGEFSIGYGNYDTFRGQFYVTGGLSDDLAVDIAGFAFIQGDGWGQNNITGEDVNDLDQYAIRTKWLYTPGDRDEFRLIFDYSEVRGNQFVSYAPVQGTTVNYGPGTTLASQRPDLAPYIATGALSPFAEVGDPFVYNGGFYDSNSPYSPGHVFQSGGVSLQWDHEFDTFRFTSITAYREGRLDLFASANPSAAPRVAVGFDLDESQFTQEIQLGSLAGATIPWVVGAFYLDASSRYPQDAGFVLTGTTIGLDSFQVVASTPIESGALFGQATVPLWEGGHLTGGLRYTIEHREISGTDTLFFPGGGSLVIPATPQEETFRRLTWRIALDHEITPDILVYASYNRGFKSGLFNTLPLASPVVSPEILDAFEVGLKTDLLDRRLRLNIAGFYYDYQDLQVTVATATAARIENGAGAEVYGIEFDFTASVTDNLTLYGAATFMDSQFTSYPQADFFTPIPLSQGGGTISQKRPPDGARGNPIPYAPSTTFNIGGTYTVPVGSGSLDFNANFSYTSRWYAHGDRNLSEPGHGLLDASVSYTFPNDQISVTLWAQNLTDETYHQYLQAGGNPGGYQQGLPGAPRTYGVRVGFEF